MLFPSRCPICDKVRPIGSAKICNYCEKTLSTVTTPFCMKCGKALEDETREYCRDCSTVNHEYNQGRAVFLYPCIRKSVYRLKYKNRKEYAEYLGWKMAQVCGKTIKEWNPDALVPVPLHEKRMQKRGYNQAELLAKELSKYIHVPVNTTLVKRERNTKPQKALNVVERQNNLKNAFKIEQNNVKLKTIVIIDDIYTTGSTIDAIAKELKAIGVQRVYYVALAIGR